MKLKTILILVAILALAGLTSAQTTGTITVSGTNPAAASITTTSDGSLGATIPLGTLNPATGSTLTSGTVDVRLRSNKAYTLTAAATALSIVGGAGADGGNTIALTDIGFGITATNLTGAHVANSGSRTDGVVTKFDYPSWPGVTNGLTPFVAGTNGTLNDITGAGATILSGARISTQGNISTNDNFILVTLGVATLPQYFTPNTSFSTTITLTIATT